MSEMRVAVLSLILLGLSTACAKSPVPEESQSMAEYIAKLSSAEILLDGGSISLQATTSRGRELDLFLDRSISANSNQSEIKVLVNGDVVQNEDSIGKFINMFDRWLRPKLSGGSFQDAIQACSSLRMIPRRRNIFWQLGHSWR